MKRADYEVAAARSPGHDTAPMRRPHDGAGMTLEEVATVLGVSRQRVQQIEREALTKLRARLAERGVRGWHYLDVAEADR